VIASEALQLLFKEGIKVADRRLEIAVSTLKKEE